MKRCETCGAPVKVEGKTTQYYVNAYDELMEVAKTMADALWPLDQVHTKAVYTTEIILGKNSVTKAKQAVKAWNEHMTIKTSEGDK